MKDKVGIIKCIDSLGRVVIPKEFRERMGLEDNVEMILSKDGALIRSPKYKLIEINDGKQ